METITKNFSTITKKDFINTLINNATSLLFGGYVRKKEHLSAIFEQLDTIDLNLVTDFRTVKKVRSKDLIFSNDSVLSFNGKNRYYKYKEFLIKIQSIIDSFDNNTIYNLIIYYIR